MANQHRDHAVVPDPSIDRGVVAACRGIIRRPRHRGHTQRLRPTKYIDSSSLDRAGACSLWGPCARLYSTCQPIQNPALAEPSGTFATLGCTLAAHAHLLADLSAVEVLRTFAFRSSV